MPKIWPRSQARGDLKQLFPLLREFRDAMSVVRVGGLCESTGGGELAELARAKSERGRVR